MPRAAVPPSIKAAIGTVISVMLPCWVVFAIGWTLLITVWLALGLPIGQGAPLEDIRAGSGIVSAPGLSA